MHTLTRLAALCCPLLIVGCMTVQHFHYIADETLEYRDKKITSIVRKDGEHIVYDVSGARYIVEPRDSAWVRRIIGYDIMNRPTSTPIEEVLEINCQNKEFNTPGTALGVLAVSGLISVILVAAAFSGGIH